MLLYYESLPSVLVGLIRGFICPDRIAWVVSWVGPYFGGDDGAHDPICLESMHVYTYIQRFTPGCLWWHYKFIFWSYLITELVLRAHFYYLTII